MNWIQIKKKLINLGRVDEITIGLKSPTRSSSISFWFTPTEGTTIECDSDEEAINLMKQVLLWIKPVVVECQK